jgi:CRP-like cAMP-binding protein
MNANKEIFAGILGSGDLCGEDSMFPENDKRIIRATVMSSAWVSSIYAQDFVTLLRLHGTLSMNVAKHFQEQRNAEQLFHLEYASQKVAERIMRALDRLCLQHGSSHPAGVRIDARLTQTEIASLVGSTRESVSLALGCLVSAGRLLRIDGFFVIPTADSNETARMR